MRRWLSSYHPRYARSLVYMLQSSLYDLGETFAWYRRVDDFRQVERRQRLDPTAKARLLLGYLRVVWVLLVLLAIVIVVVGLDHHSVLTWLVGLIILASAPWLLLISLVVPLWLGKSLIQNPRQRKIVAEARARLVKHPAIKIAIAGSYGKTTFKDALSVVLTSGLGEEAVKATPGNLNTPIGISRFIGQLSGQEKVLIFELGEFYPGDIKELCDLVEPDRGVITGINEAHLSRFKTLDRTVSTIFELADYLGDRPCYKNGESELVVGRAGNDERLYSRDGLGGWKVSDAKTDLDGVIFRLEKGKRKLKLHSQLLGLHQIGPLVAIVDLADQLGLSDEAIEKAVAKTKPFEHRLQPRTDATGMTIIDDSYNGNPAGAKVAIELLGELKAPHRFYLTPGLVETGMRAPEVHRTIGQQLAGAKIEAVMLVETSVTPFIEEGLTEANFKGQVLRYATMPAALAALPSITVKGDIVLIQNDWSDNYA
jgi:UDP-N-acetylmuramoyl-tripeptide--D-alanyl-D-alanine ligase